LMTRTEPFEHFTALERSPRTSLDASLVLPSSGIEIVPILCPTVGAMESWFFVIEACLGHQVVGIERHYLRTTFFDERQKLMEEWARFVTGGTVEERSQAASRSTCT